MNQKGVSGIVVTVLLILVAIAAVAIVAAFLIPFIRGSLNEGSECFSFLGKTEIVAGDFTCFSSEIAWASVMIKRTGVGNVDLDGYSIVFSGSGESKRFDTTGEPWEESAEDVMKQGESRVYQIDTSEDFDEETIIDKVEVSPILKGGKVCEAITAPVPLTEVCPVE